MAVNLSGCPLSYTASFFIRVLHVLATLADSLLNGDAISKHFEERMEELERKMI